MNYKGYEAKVVFDDEARLFHGEVINTRDVITFQGKSVDELENAFKQSVEDYLKWCEEDGVHPEKPFSGKFNIRISPELHRKAVLAANKIDYSLNKFIEKALLDELAIIS